MEYELLPADEANFDDLSEQPEMPIDLTVCRASERLGTEQLNAALIRFEPGEEIRYHAHAEQEEFYYVVEGRFSVKLGRSGDTEVVELEAGACYAAGPEIGHGHRYVGDDVGVMLATGAPAVEDPGLDPHELDS